jgi:hypothetical protein
MWVRKTKEEIEKEKNKNEYFAGIKMTPLKYAVFTSIFAPILSIASTLILGDYSKIHNKWTKVAFSDIPDRLPSILFGSFFVGIIVYIVFRINKSCKSYSGTYLCPNCGKVKSDDGNYKCECGGEYVRIEEMKWAEE